MYDNNYVASLSKAEALSLMKEIKFTLQAARDHVLFGNGRFKVDTSTANPHHVLPMSQNSTHYKTVCIYLADGSDAVETMEEFIKIAPHIKCYSELHDLYRDYVLESSKNQYFVPASIRYVVNPQMSLFMNKYIQLFANGSAFNDESVTFLYDTQGKPVEELSKEWHSYAQEDNANIAAEARMLLFKLIKNAEYISGPNDELLILNPILSIQYNVESVVDDDDECGSYTEKVYCVMTLKGDKIYCNSEIDLLTHIYRHKHLFEV